MTLALEGIRIVEVAQLAAVPMAGRLLADLGAEVIHVEHPLRGDVLRVILAGQGVNVSGSNYVWENYNRNKKSITVDISQKGGKGIIYRLVGKADVFLTNMRPFELDRFGLSYYSLSQVNPKLIYASLTGLGKKGAERNEPGYDQTGYWARSGVAHSIIPPGTPPDCRVGAFGNNMAGMFLAFGIVTALFARDRTGIGQEVDVSLFQTGVTQLSWDIAETLVTRRDRPRVARKDQPNALMNAYQTKDRRWLLLVILQPDRYWPALCRAIGREDLEHDPRFDSFQPRLENHAALFNILEEVFLTKTLDEWKTCLAGIPFAPVQSLSEVIADPQARANDFFLPFDHPTYGRMEVVANPIHLSKTPPTVRTAAPEFSQHTEEVLLECGYAWKDIERFKQQHII